MSYREQVRLAQRGVLYVLASLCPGYKPVDVRVDLDESGQSRLTIEFAQAEDVADYSLQLGLTPERFEEMDRTLREDGLTQVCSHHLCHQGKRYVVALWHLKVG
jgi:hypothetical protein